MGLVEELNIVSDLYVTFFFFFELRPCYSLYPWFQSKVHKRSNTKFSIFFVYFQPSNICQLTGMKESVVGNIFFPVMGFYHEKNTIANFLPFLEVTLCRKAIGENRA